MEPFILGYVDSYDD
uniref:Uncharacterized protein n=1 Tax=Anguilla anguilla TaxID=7936 RepID=A0A0E9PNA6_ANGAN